MQKHSTGLSGRPFNTLAQNGTDYLSKPAIIVQGNGSDLTNTEGMKNKAKRKHVTQVMVLSLIDASIKFGSPELKKSYWNTFHCQNKLFTANGKIYTKYCKNRCCTICNANRKADVLNRYMPTINSWNEPYFVTLTVKSVPFHRLRPTMQSMLRQFRLITETHRKRALRSKGEKLIGIRSLESNFNPNTQEYNPHFHCIVANKKMAYSLLREWLKRGKPDRINRKGQMVRRVDDTKHDLIEVVKYGSKIFTAKDIYAKGKNKKEKRGESTIYAGALNNIFHAMRGLRIFERFGFNLPADCKPLSPGATLVKDYHEWHFHLPSTDWLSDETGNPLSNYIPSSDLLSLFANSINIKLE